MESQLTRRRMLGSAATLVGGAALLAAPGAAAGARGGCRTPTPEGFRKLLVYIAEGPASAGSITDPDAVLAFQRSFVVFGDYNIKVDRPGGGRDDTIIVADGGIRNVLTFPPSLP